MGVEWMYILCNSIWIKGEVEIINFRKENGNEDEVSCDGGGSFWYIYYHLCLIYYKLWYWCDVYKRRRQDVIYTNISLCYCQLMS